MASESPGLAFSELAIETRNGLRYVLVGAPQGSIELDRERLDRMRAGDLSSSLDVEIVAATAAAKHVISVFLFRALGNSPDDRWGFSDELDNDEVAEMAYYFLRSHIELYRKLVDVGVGLLIGVEFGPREIHGYDRATRRLASELEEALVQLPRAASASERIDLWIAERQAIWSGLAFDQFVTRRLADSIVSAERQLQQMRRMLAELG